MGQMIVAKDQKTFEGRGSGISYRLTPSFVVAARMYALASMKCFSTVELSVGSSCSKDEEDVAIEVRREKSSDHRDRNASLLSS